MISRPQLRVANRVWRRNARVFSKQWRTGLLPPFLDPFLWLLGLGLGLGAYVSSVNGVDYRDFVATGLCASAVVWQASFTSTFELWLRMDLGGVHGTMLATPIEPEDIVLGELLWGATKAATYATAFLATIVALGFADSPWIVALPPFLFLGGLVFTAAGMAFTVVNSRIENYAYYFTFVVQPAFLFGGIFFPFTELPEWAQAFGWFTPTLHLVDIARALASGNDLATVMPDALWLATAAALLAVVPMYRLRGRLVA